MPPLMSNHGNFIVSLGEVCRWLGRKAEALGVEIYPGFAAAEVLYGANGEVVGVATGDMGIGRDGKPKDSFTRGMELRAKYTLFAEGARGQPDQAADRPLRPRSTAASRRNSASASRSCGRSRPTSTSPAWCSTPSAGRSTTRTGGGSFLYHFGDNLVAVGFVVHLNYDNPYLSPFEEFQRFKTHPLVRDTFAGGKRIGYGARAITEGGWQSVPKLSFPGGALIGCAAGFLNVPRIKGTHNAMLSGMLAAEHVALALAAGRANDELADYEAAWRALRRSAATCGRCATPSRCGRSSAPCSASALGGIDMWTNTLGFSLFGTLGHGKPDAECLKPAAQCRPIAYPKPDGKLTFDRLSSVFLSNTNHEEDQPVHLRVADPGAAEVVRARRLCGPSARYCPAGVYEWVRGGRASPRFVINAQNCVHCKTCDIKDPNQNITWVAPEGGGGPNYPNM